MPVNLNSQETDERRSWVQDHAELLYKIPEIVLHTQWILSNGIKYFNGIKLVWQITIHKPYSKPRGWGYMLSKAWWPKFDPQNLCFKAMCGGIRCWGGKDSLLSKFQVIVRDPISNNTQGWIQVYTRMYMDLCLHIHKINKQNKFLQLINATTFRICSYSVAYASLELLRWDDSHRLPHSR